MCGLARPAFALPEGGGPAADGYAGPGARPLPPRALLLAGKARPLASPLRPDAPGHLPYFPPLALLEQAVEASAALWLTRPSEASGIPSSPHSLPRALLQASEARPLTLTLRYCGFPPPSVTSPLELCKSARPEGLAALENVHEGWLHWRMCMRGGCTGECA